MRRKIVVTIIILVCFILQCTVFRSLAFGGIIPNLMIILTSSFGFMRGDREGLVIGFFCGLLCDIFFGQSLGFYALLYMFIGFVIRYHNHRLKSLNKNRKNEAVNFVF